MMLRIIQKVKYSFVALEMRVRVRTCLY
jgi:hypothetical protein